ncbi:bifunctional 3-(3-hydroxy-phenyl)propionate/3-hydroxycinnamic acid hydroxylase [Nocardioides sp. LHG3406-4]|uniref:bifunctional 3-(3-hydroxy-phenyl)propionate/3-hydroxycinnamic acid hydroxylase n=1 Tax=Nocardioides sp. LHG3406-4 TaxID=2804575 RepID=UPI003CEC11CB
MSNASRPSEPVLVVGAGPVGLTIANLLVAQGVSVIIVERNASTSDEAKAISLDAESLRVYQSAGLSEQIEQVVVPGTGTRYYDRHDRVLFQARGGRPYQLGYAFKNQFAQPELENVLAGQLAQRGTHVRFATEVVGLTDHAAGVTAQLRDLATGRLEETEVSWVAACDGGRSTVRQVLGIEMSGRSHEQTWLVVDVLDDHHRERYGMHHGNPRRPAVIVPGRDGRCRYEFRLKPGEGVPSEPPSSDLVADLLAPHRAITDDQIERSVVYRFHAIVAEQWRSGHCFLLGDAAHMMPPFAGQGLNSGVRDAANLAWKLAMVWHGDLAPDVLATYQLERRQHAKDTVEFSERLGRVVMTTSRWRALVRDAVVRAMLLAPAGRRYLGEMRYRPKTVHAKGVVSRGARDDRPLVGSLLPQPWVLPSPSLRPRRLDDVLGSGFALLGVDVDGSDWDHVAAIAAGHGLPALREIDVVWEDLLPPPAGTRPAIVDAEDTLNEVMAGVRGSFVLVKPDRYVAAVFVASEADAVVADLARWLRVPTPAGGEKDGGPEAPAVPRSPGPVPSVNGVGSRDGSAL